MTDTDDLVQVDENNGVEGNDDENFQVIGNLKRLKPIKVIPLLPKWMNNSTKFNGNLVTDSINLEQFDYAIDQKIINNLLQNKISKLFPVQKAVVPFLIDSFQKLRNYQQRDVCVLSPTGSGKTLAFAIPIVNHLLTRVVTQIRALVILPVSDLANQVYKMFQTLCKDTTLRVGLATSSFKKSQNDSSMFYRKKADDSGYICLVDILIATPGKLIDLIQQNNGFHLNHLEVLVIDEVDRMMNETQIHWLREIEYSVFESNTKQICLCSSSSGNFLARNMDVLCSCSISPASLVGKSLYKILFSATLTTDPEKIDQLNLYNPILFNVSSEEEANVFQDPKQTIPINLKENIIIIDTDKKPLVIWHLIKSLNYRKILCFTDSVNSTHRLHQLMKNLPEINVCEFSSNQNLKTRMKILKQFENGTIDMIISTDIFARGIDVSGINCVICYDPPRNETAYIHRIGRTARAGQEGTAISLITPTQLSHFTIVSRRAHKGKKNQIDRITIKDSDLKPLISLYQKALKSLETDVNKEGKSVYLKKRKQIVNSKFSNKRLKDK